MNMALLHEDKRDSLLMDYQGEIGLSGLVDAC